MYTHTWPDTQSPFDISFSFLSSPVFPMRQPSQNATGTAYDHDMLILQKQSQSPYFHQERQGRWLFFHWPQRFLLPKIQNALLLPPLSFKVAQLLPSWMKTNFRRATIPRCMSMAQAQVKKQWSNKCSPNGTEYLINMEQDSTYLSQSICNLN